MRTTHTNGAGTNMKTKRLAAYDNSWLGTMNAKIATPVVFKGRTLMFDGTTVDMVRTLVKAGAVDGDKFSKPETGRVCRIYDAPHDSRAFGMWATEFNLSH